MVGNYRYNMTVIFFFFFDIDKRLSILHHKMQIHYVIGVPTYILYDGNFIYVIRVYYQVLMYLVKTFFLNFAHFNTFYLFSFFTNKYQASYYKSGYVLIQTFPHRQVYNFLILLHACTYVLYYIKSQDTSKNSTFLISGDRGMSDCFMFPFFLYTRCILSSLYTVCLRRHISQSAFSDKHQVVMFTFPQFIL